MINILICGVGGQGLVMTSGIVSEVARQAGYDVKSNDVIGLSQRGGRVWANIRFGKKVYSPNIPVGEADFLLSLEPLEGYRYSSMLKKEGVILMNDKKIYPADVVFDKAEYPEVEIQTMTESFETHHLDASEVSKKLGNKMAANTVILGMLAKKLDFEKDLWLSVILENVPEKAKKINEAAFDYGYDFVK